MAAITTAVIGVASAGYTIYNAEQQKKEAKSALNKHKPQELSNKHEEIRISTIGSDLMREENGRIAASAVEAARGGGIRGVMSTIPKIQENTNSVNEKSRAYLDDQVIKKEYAVAQEGERIRAIKEQRDIDKLAGLGTALDVAKHDTMTGIRDGFNSIAYGLNDIEASRGGDTTNYEKAFGDSMKDSLKTDYSLNFRSSLPGASLSNYDKVLKQQQDQKFLDMASAKYGL